MGPNDYYKKYIEKAINANPTTITIKRIKKIPDGFDGWIEEPIELPPQVVSIYQKRAQRERISDSGTTIGYMASNVEKMLCKGDADVKEGDRFEANDREYKVSFVNNFFDICKQAELEVIK